MDYSLITIKLINYNLKFYIIIKDYLYLTLIRL